MDMILAGNGFDLSHHFPTRYLDFLHTIQFLVAEYNDSYDTVGTVLGNKLLGEKNPFLKACYMQHSKVYDSVELPRTIINKIITIAKDNLWYKYLLSTLSEDALWIDLEHEIAMVIEAFNDFFCSEEEIHCIGNKIQFEISSVPRNPKTRYIIAQFGFFFDALETPLSKISAIKMVEIGNRFTIEVPLGSNSYELNTTAIISELYRSLEELIEILRLYLLCFVDNPIREMATNRIMPKFPALPAEAQFFSFNYTNTYEILYGGTNVIHIHGNTQSKIVLGVNPDESDECYKMDTSFVQFKKYYQRIFYKTDQTYLLKVRALRMRHEHRTLYVIGHSLDVTDEDIIKELFDLASRIVILYHDEEAAKNYIKNLIKMYGKHEFDEMRTKKDINFFQQSEVKW